MSLKIGIIAKTNDVAKATASRGATIDSPPKSNAFAIKNYKHCTKSYVTPNNGTKISIYFQLTGIEGFNTKLLFNNNKVDGPTTFRKNHLATVVSKKLEKSPNLERYAELLKVIEHHEFQDKHGDFLNIPFLLEENPRKAIMKRINGVSLTNFENRKLNLTKSALLSLYNTMKAMVDTFGIVHTEISVADIVLEQGTNRLIFVSSEKCKKYSFEYCQRYEEETIKDDFYVSAGEFAGLKDSMSVKLKSIFQLDKGSIFDSSSFESAADDETFQVKIFV